MTALSLRGFAAASIALAGLACAATPERVDPVDETVLSLLGQPLPPPAIGEEARARMDAQLAEARRAYDAAPTDADSIIWLGRRTAYLGRYREAIAIYTRGIALHPEDARLYRHRGHRYLTVRALDSAIADLERAYGLVAGQPDEIEPDGQPNARGIPVSTLNSNIRYHLGLAYYLKGDFEAALPVYREDVAARVNDDMLVATSHWLYMTLRRLGNDALATHLLGLIGPDLEVIENEAYYRLLRFYQGELTEAELLAAPAEGDPVLQNVTVSYGVGNWHLYNGRPDEARAVFERILESRQWAGFGYLAAEAEMARSASTGGLTSETAP
ncbi:MAG: tetratricopeptide repeat protein [Gemmatimonadales bacterium]